MVAAMIGELEGGMAVLVLLAALVLDALFGEMGMLFRLIPHPVAALGRLIGALDRRLNKPERSARARLWRGVFTVFAVVGLAAGAGWLVTALMAGVPGGWMVEVLLVAVLVAQRGLHDHVAAVARALRGDGLAGGRAAIRHLVSRDPASLDEHGVARAALESLSENFADAVVAPVFWYAVAGLPGICAYKAINTLDSMIGYRTETYADFGRAAARLDDAASWIPARLAGLWIVAAAVFRADCKPGRALRVMWRDARTHASPNAGWPESAFAGALGLALGGKRGYPGGGEVEHWIGGEGERRFGPAGIDRALRLFIAGCAVNAAAAGAFLVVLAGG